MVLLWVSCFLWSACRWAYHSRGTGNRSFHPLKQKPAPTPRPVLPYRDSSWITFLCICRPEKSFSEADFKILIHSCVLSDSVSLFSYCSLGCLGQNVVKLQGYRRYKQTASCMKLPNAVPSRPSAGSRLIRLSPLVCAIMGLVQKAGRQKKKSFVFLLKIVLFCHYTSCTIIHNSFIVKLEMKQILSGKSYFAWLHWLEIV